MTSILVDGSLLLKADQTGIGSYTRALATALHDLGVDFDLLLSDTARSISGAPSIALADQVFGNHRPRRGGLVGQLARLWNVRGGLRSKLPAYPVPVEGIELATLNPRLPEHRGLQNASDFLMHSQTVFALRGGLTEIVPKRTPAAMHWTVAAPVFVRGCPNIYTIHDVIPLKFPHFSIDEQGRAARLHAKIAQRADHILTVSERSRQDIKTVLGVPDDRMRRRTRAGRPGRLGAGGCGSRPTQTGALSPACAQR